MNKKEEERFKKQAGSGKVSSCIFCSHPLVKSGTLKFLNGSKKKIKVCAKCNLPKTEKDMELILRWERKTGKNVYQKKADWKEIKEHFIKHRILEYIEKNPESDFEDIAKALFISDKLASDLTTELARDGKLEI